MPSSFFSKLKEIILTNPYEPREWAIFLLFMPIDIAIHEIGHILAAKYFNCFSSLKFSLWKKHYWFAVYTTRNETIRQGLIVTLTGVLAGIAVCFISALFIPMWHYLIVFSIGSSSTDLSTMTFWYRWGKENGFDRPVWHGPIGTWCDRKRFWHPLICVDVYEADDFPCYYDDD